MQAIAFRKGLNGSGGMPEDFDVANHRLQPVRLENFYGLVFGTFDEDIDGVESFLGEEMSGLIRRAFGKKVKRLGSHSQVLHNNWKLYAENLRDSYHATLLHTFYTTFNLYDVQRKPPRYGRRHHDVRQKVAPLQLRETGDGLERR